MDDHDAVSDAGSSVPAVKRDEHGRFLPGCGPVSAIPRTRGGQTGNLNASRHPWRAYWNRRALKPAERWVLALVADYVEELVADKGGETEVTAGERRVMETAAAARVCWLLALASPDVDGSRKDAGRFMAVERQCLGDLGLERRQRPVPSLRDYLAARAAALPPGPPNAAQAGT